MLRTGLVIVVTLFTGCSPAAGTPERMVNDTGLTGVICYDERRACGILRAVQDAGIDVPGDLSVVAYYPGVFAAVGSPPLTSFYLGSCRAGEA